MQVRADAQGSGRRPKICARNSSSSNTRRCCTQTSGTPCPHARQSRKRGRPPAAHRQGHGAPLAQRFRVSDARAKSSRSATLRVVRGRNKGKTPDGIFGAQRRGASSITSARTGRRAAGATLGDLHRSCAVSRGADARATYRGLSDGCRDVGASRRGRAFPRRAHLREHPPVASHFPRVFPGQKTFPSLFEYCQFPYRFAYNRRSSPS